MKTFSKYLIALLALLVPVASMAADVTREAEVSGIKFRLSLGPGEIHTGEPVLLKLALTNVGAPSAAPIFSAKLQLPEGNDVDVFVQPPGEAETRLEGAVEPGVYSGTAIEVPPGRTIEHTLKLQYDNSFPKGYLFSKPGEYNVRASVRYAFSTAPESRRLSVAAKIKVVAPEGEAAEAFSKLSDVESAKALQLNSITNDQLLARFQEVGEKYPKTSYGRACLRAAALHVAYKRGGDIKSALPLLKKYETNYRDEPDTDLIVYTIIASHHIIGEQDVARDWMYYMLDKHPNSSLLRKQDPLYKYYYLEPAEQAFVYPWYLYEKPWIVPGSKAPTSLKMLEQ